jgi:hypothetical protein
MEQEHKNIMDTVIPHPVRVHHMPKQDKVALAYLYFIPKPHKVNFNFIFCHVNIYFRCCNNRKEHH